MAVRRPYADAAALFEAADEIWRGLDSQDWLEAFAYHPQIGENRSEKEAAAAAQLRSSRWSAGEQSGVAGHPAETLTRLAEGNRAYRDRFGYIFIVCATGKTAEEMLAILARRLQNDASTELPIAAEEQRRIIRLRLEKLLAADVF
jgi:OHCU decarboxylase